MFDNFDNQLRMLMVLLLLLLVALSPNQHRGSIVVTLTYHLYHQSILMVVVKPQAQEDAKLYPEIQYMMVPSFE